MAVAPLHLVLPAWNARWFGLGILRQGPGSRLKKLNRQSGLSFEKPLLVDDGPK